MHATPGDVLADGDVRPCERDEMRSNVTLIAAVWLASMPTLTTGAPPREQGATITKRPTGAALPGPYRMSGAALMMTPDEVGSALAAAGFSWKPSDRGSVTKPSFAEQVEERLSGRAVTHRTEVPFIQPWTKGRELIRVRYGSFPEGPRAIWFHWETEDASPSAGEILTTLTKRYGPGWRLKPFLPPRWCSPMPCSVASATLMPSDRQIDLTAPAAVGGERADDNRIDAAASARQADKHGSF